MDEITPLLFAIRNMPAVFIEGNLTVAKSVKEHKEKPFTVAELVAMALTKTFQTPALLLENASVPGHKCGNCDIVTVVIPHACKLVFEDQATPQPIAGNEHADDDPNVYSKLPPSDPVRKLEDDEAKEAEPEATPAPAPETAPNEQPSQDVQQQQDVPRTQD